MKYSSLLLVISILGLCGCYDLAALSAAYDAGAENVDLSPPDDSGQAIQVDLLKKIDGCGDSCMPTIPRDGLVGEWLFNGNAIDTSGSSNNGIVHGATLAKDRFGQKDAAYFFDGKMAYIEVPSSQSLNLTDNLSISVWMNVSAYGGIRQGIVSKYRDDVSPGYDLRITGTNAPFNVLDFDEAGLHVVSGSSAAPSIQEWHHVVAVMDNSVGYVYVDGVLTYTGNPSYKAAVNSNPIGIGIDYTLASGRFFGGNIDDVRIYNRVLTPQEVLSLTHEGGI